MLRLSEILGRRVAVAEEAGRLAELAADPADEYPAISALRVRAKGRPTREYRWVDVQRFDPGELVLRRDAQPVAADPGQLYLAEHLMDLQIVDLVGKCASRVGNVLLAQDGTRLRVAGVEAGAAPCSGAWGSARLAGRVIDWRDLHHTISLGSPGARVHDLSPQELAALLASLPSARGAEVVRAVEPRRAGDALALAHEDHAARVPAQLSASERDRIMRHLPGKKRASLGRQLLPRVPRRFRHVLGARRGGPS